MLRSDYKYGQGYKAKSDESKGSKKARYAKDAKDDHKGFMKLKAKDPKLAKEIVERYKNKYRTKRLKDK